MIKNNDTQLAIFQVRDLNSDLEHCTQDPCWRGNWSTMIDIALQHREALSDLPSEDMTEGRAHPI